MAYVLSMPRLSDTMDEGVLVAWLKKEGDAIEAGEVVAEVETDKATMELECFDGGILGRILVKAGEAIPVGGAVAIILEEEGEDISTLLEAVESSGDSKRPGAKPAADGAISSDESQRGAASSSTRIGTSRVHRLPLADELSHLSSLEGTETASGSVSNHAGSIDGDRIKASPLARRMATENRLELAELNGSGPGGRIIKRDVQLALGDRHGSEELQSRESQEAVTPTPMSAMRKTIAVRMTEAKQSIPHFYLTLEVDMAPAVKLRAQLNAALAEEGLKISLNDLLLKACAAALSKHPEVNSSFEEGQLFNHQSIDLGLAVALQGGLVTPVIRGCGQKSLGQMAREGQLLVQRAKERRLKPNEYSGATFTVSNLGMYGIVEFSAIINPPQAAILAVGAVRDEAVVVDGALTVGKRMKVTLSCDHRVLDGAMGASFLSTLRRVLENPNLLLL